MSTSAIPPTLTLEKSHFNQQDLLLRKHMIWLHSIVLLSKEFNHNLLQCIVFLKVHIYYGMYFCMEITVAMIWAYCNMLFDDNQKKKLIFSVRVALNMPKLS